MGGIAILAVALFLALALLPVWILGARGAEWFPSDNMMGPAGGLIRSLLVFTFGAASALAPIAIAVGGRMSGRWFEPLVGGLLVTALAVAGWGIIGSQPVVISLGVIGAVTAG